MRDKRLEWYLRKLERERASKKLKSPCLPGRLKHQYSSPGTRGPPRPDSTCFHCRKTLRQVRKEQRRKRA